MTSTLSQDAHSSQTHDHDEHGDHRMFGLATFLVADAMTFAGFFAAYLTFKAVNPLPEEPFSNLNCPCPSSTQCCCWSSATFHKAGQAIRLGDHGRCRRWLLISAALGLAFLVSQMVEYFTLPFGLADNLYASTFYAATGPRITRDPRGPDDLDRVVAGQAGRGRITAQEHFPLEAAELYWHFVDGIWVVLFVILYLL